MNYIKIYEIDDNNFIPITLSGSPRIIYYVVYEKNKNNGNCFITRQL